MEVVSRRLELLKLEGLGFSQAEIVNELSQKSSCTKRAIYKDFETRGSWQPTLQSVVEPNAVLLKVINRYEQIYRQACMRLLTSSNELAQLGALNTMLYTQLIAFKDDDFTARVAHSEQESCQFIEAGFEFVCDFNGNKLFRKRK